jgi:hypothetical protein
VRRPSTPGLAHKRARGLQAPPPQKGTPRRAPVGTPSVATHNTRGGRVHKAAGTQSSVRAWWWRGGVRRDGTAKGAMGTSGARRCPAASAAQPPVVSTEPNEWRGVGGGGGVGGRVPGGGLAPGRRPAPVAGTQSPQRRLGARAQVHLVGRGAATGHPRGPATGARWTPRPTYRCTSRTGTHRGPYSSRRWQT